MPSSTAGAAPGDQPGRAVEPRPARPLGEALALPPPVVTGEAVVLDLRPASPLTRALAIALDAAILVAAGVALLFVVPLALGRADSDAAAAVGLACAVTLVVLVPMTWEALTRGRSPGKAAAGLRVVRDDGGPVRARHALVRALVGVGELWLLAGSAALLCAMASPRGKRVGDLLAGTVVVRERSGVRAAPLVQCPPALAGWVSSADLARLPEDVAARARAVLTRATRLDPAAHRQLVADLTAQVLARTSPPPPAGTPPEALLAAVLAERRERDRVVLERARVRRDALAERSRRLTGL